MPSEQELTEMGTFNEELVKAGVMLAGEGLHPSSRGARVALPGGKRTVDRRPVRRDQGAGRRLLDFQVQVEGRGDRVGQALPEPDAWHGAEIEIRQIFEADDFGAECTPELHEQAAAKLRRAHG